jgi:hypothetical protein
MSGLTLVPISIRAAGQFVRAAGYVQEALLPARSWASEYLADGGRHDQSEPAGRIRWGAAA